MKIYSFHEGEIPENFSLEFEESLFNTRAHRMLQTKDAWHSFYILNEAKKKVSGAIHFHVSKELASSPQRAPFGSLEFEAGVPFAVIFEFLQFLEKQLAAKGVSSITIKNYPNAYQYDNASILQIFLLNLKYEIRDSEIGSVLDVGADDARHSFHRAHKLQLDKAHRAGLAFNRIDVQELEHVYTFIDRCQRIKGYQLSMNFIQLRETVEAFPERFEIFGVFNAGSLVAASISIRVRKTILYDFYHDHDSSCDHLSPVIMLIEGMYQYCAVHQIDLLDLGTSALEGKPNLGLLQFKRSLGARPTSKLTFHKQLVK